MQNIKIKVRNKTTNHILTATLICWKIPNKEIPFPYVEGIDEDGIFWSYSFEDIEIIQISYVKVL